MARATLVQGHSQTAGYPDGISIAPALDTAAAVIALALSATCGSVAGLKLLKRITAVPTTATNAVTSMGTFLSARICCLVNPLLSTSTANRSYHLFDLRFFTVDGGTGAQQRTFHGAKADTG
jgi:hypothetical protein